MINKIDSNLNFTSKQTVVTVSGKKNFNELNLLIKNRVFPIVNQHIKSIEYIKKDLPCKLISEVGGSTATLNEKLKGKTKASAHSFATPSPNELINIFATKVKKKIGYYIIKDGLEGNNTITKNTTTFVKRLAYLIVDHLSDPDLLKSNL